jgi:hypothetical protein
MGNRPTFIDIGPGRCGTSWLFEVLSAHPAVAMATVKETEYFNTHFRHGKGWYEAHFPVSNRAIGEISNNYYLDAEAARRIQAYDPNMKIIVNIRQPYSLLWSFYQFGIRRGYDFAGLDRTLDEPIGRIMGSGYEHRRKAGSTTAADNVTLLDSVLLERRLRPYFDSFPRHNIYVLIYERIETDSAALLSEIYDFLGVDPTFRPPAAAAVVNAALRPRSRVLARITTNVSYALRKMRAHRLLGRLHRSVTIKRLLYQSPAQRHGPGEIRAILSPAVQRTIDDDISRLLELYPPVSRWWHLVPVRQAIEARARLGT